MRTRALVLLTSVLALVVGATHPAVAGPLGDDNAAVVVNTKDGTSAFKLALSIRRTADAEITPTNTAIAYASCESCQTVAIALQVVFAAGHAVMVDASNVAVAVNDHCVNCDTLAAAYQFVLVTDERMHLTPEGRREVAGIRRELKRLRRSRLPASEIRDRVDGLATRLQQTLTTELVPARSGRLQAGRSRLETCLRWCRPRRWPS